MNIYEIYLYVSLIPLELPLCTLKYNNCLTICCETAWVITNILSRMTSIDGKRVNALHHGMCHQLSRWHGTLLMSCGSHYLPQSCQRRNTLPNVRSDQLCGKPHWLQEPICHICSTWQHQFQQQSLLPWLSLNYESNKVSSLPTIPPILHIAFSFHCQIQLLARG